VLDGWWIEGYFMSNKKAGWTIGPESDDEMAKNLDDLSDAEDLYEKLEHSIIPMFRENQKEWIERMKYSIKLGAYFNTYRMMEEYAIKAYMMERQPLWKSKLNYDYD